MHFILHWTSIISFVFFLPWVGLIFIIFGFFIIIPSLGMIEFLGWERNEDNLTLFLVIFFIPAIYFTGWSLEYIAIFLENFLGKPFNMIANSKIIKK